MIIMNFKFEHHCERQCKEDTVVLSIACMSIKCVSMCRFREVNITSDVTSNMFSSELFESSSKWVSVTSQVFSDSLIKH